MLKKVRAIVVVALAALTLLSLSLTAQNSKPSIYVEPFDYSTVMTSVQAVFGTNVNIGDGIRAMMVKRMSDGGSFTIVERAKIDNVLKEQDFGASGRVKQGTQAKIGNITGARLAVMGDIVVFGRDDRKVGGNAGGFGGGVFGRDMQPPVQAEGHLVQRFQPRRALECQNADLPAGHRVGEGQLPDEARLPAPGPSGPEHHLPLPLTVQDRIQARPRVWDPLLRGGVDLVPQVGAVDDPVRAVRRGRPDRVPNQRRLAGLEQLARVLHRELGHS